MDREILNELTVALQKGDAIKTQKFVKIALKKGYEPEQILTEGLVSSMNTIAEKFKRKQIFVPDLLLATRAMNAGIFILKPKLKKQLFSPIGKVLIGTIEGDLHDIGKNLVKVFLERAGFEVIDLGNDVPVNYFIEAIKKFKPQILGLSASLTTTMYGMRDVIKALEKEGLRENLLIVVGGVPITESFATGIGADIYDMDGTKVADKAKEKLKCSNF
ncbi:MAG: 5-methyltetrahydrofolate--homocysteine methyltransferase [Clostridia bacterium]|nr:5-methyltetrahydrofolate--homocysteine methyltransferase [Clostridia bacterium]